MRFLFTKGAVQADGNWSRKPERSLESSGMTFFKQPVFRQSGWKTSSDFIDEMT